MSDRLEVESIAALQRLLGLDAVRQRSANDFTRRPQARMEDAVRFDQVETECHLGQLGALAAVGGEKRLDRLQAQEDVNRSPAEYSAKPRFRDLARLTDRVMQRTRLAVQGLCSPVDHIPSFGSAFATLLTESGLSSIVQCRVVEEGRPRILTAWLWDEVYTIGREAIVYAYRHSGAKEIEVEVHYLAAKLRMVVRDDGRGIDARELRHDRSEQPDLWKMHQRAELIGAQLRIFSRVGLGTELDLCIPAPIAFAPINYARSSASGKRGAGVVVARYSPLGLLTRTEEVYRDRAQT